MEAKQRDQDLRDAWARRLAQYRAEQLVYLDESGINSNITERTHGYGPKGERIHAKVSGIKAPNLSLLPAITIDGYIACSVFEGAVNADTFYGFVKDRVLPLCTPFPGPRSVLVMDNAKIHKNEVFSHYFFTKIEIERTHTTIRCKA
jgi:hypothetical protein